MQPILTDAESVGESPPCDASLSSGSAVFRADSLLESSVNWRNNLTRNRRPIQLRSGKSRGPASNEKTTGSVDRTPLAVVTCRDTWESPAEIRRWRMETLWHRIQFAFSITYHYLFPQLTMGLALLIVVFKVLALPHGQRAIQRSRAVLGTHLRPQLRHGGRDGHPARIPVRDQLGPVLQLRRRDDRPDPGDGGGLRVLSGIDLSGAVSVR